MSDAAEERATWFKKFRAEWFREMRPLGSYVPWELQEYVQLDEADEKGPFRREGLLQNAPQLRPEHLRNCVVVPDRNTILERLPKGGVVAEVGTLHGEFARQILQIVQPQELHVIDTEIRPRVRQLAEDPSLQGRLHVHRSDSVAALESFADSHFDWIYIDARHDYDGVKRDIHAARTKVKADGLLVFNDYTMWSYVEMEPYGVVRAVNELCLNEGWEIIYLALPGSMYCDVALRRMKSTK
jgi:hypothetical protein